MTPDPFSYISRLRPYQKEFAEQFLKVSPRLNILKSDPGLGASLTAATIVQIVALGDPGATIIILLSSKMLQAQESNRLSQLGLRSEVVDRFKFRELRDEAGIAASPWKPGNTYIVTYSLAKQPDVMAAVLAASWNLLIALEGDKIDRDSEFLIERLIKGSRFLRSLVIMSAFQERVPSFDAEAVVTRWGGPNLLPNILKTSQIEMVAFNRGEPEKELEKIVRQLSLTLANLENGVRLQDLLTGAFDSSPAAIEARLGRIRARLAVEGDDSYVGPGVSSRETRLGALEPDRQRVLELVDVALRRLEHLDVDSKLARLVRELRYLRAEARSGKRIVLFAQFRATLFYLQASLEDVGYTVQIVHAGMSATDRAGTMEIYSQTGEVLIGTEAVIAAGLELPPPDIIVLYDQPSNEQTLYQLLTRFGVSARTSSSNIRIVALSASHVADALNARS